MQGVSNRDFHNRLRHILLKCEVIREVFHYAQSHPMPKNWCIGGGCIPQIIWNSLEKRPLLQEVHDIDMCYFDSDNLSSQSESQWGNILNNAFGKYIKFDVKNQARVHEWVKEKMGYSITPYSDVFEPIRSVPVTACNVGIFMENGEMKIYAPHGLEPLFLMEVHPNTACSSAKNYELYAPKIKRWQQIWPKLKVIKPPSSFC